MAFLRDQERALRELVELWSAERFVVIGAAALGQHLDMRWRGTADLDLTVSAEPEEAQANLAGLISWTRDPRLDHRWISASGVSIDVVPASDRLIELGQVEGPSGDQVLDLRGIRTAFRTSLRVLLTDGTEVQVASLPALFVLKCVAWLDRPAQRERDLGDLAHVLDEFVGPDDDRRWIPAVVDRNLDYEDVPAFLLGVTLREMGEPDDLEAVAEFLRRMGADNALDAAHQARMVRLGPRTWSGSPAVLDGRLAALAAGLGAGD